MGILPCSIQLQFCISLSPNNLGNSLRPTGEINREPTGTDSTYIYHLRIINPKKRSDYVTRTWHGVSSKFHTPSALRAQIQESFPDDVPSTTDFNVSYLEGNTRHWIVVENDLLAMYSTFCPSSKINLCCDTKAQDDCEPAAKKRKVDTDKPNSSSDEVLRFSRS